jgi:uncharacterized pyridoxamine 5'-phosphate oxidase family protein
MKTQNQKTKQKKLLRRFETLFSSFVLTSNEKGGTSSSPGGVRLVQGTVLYFITYRAKLLNADWLMKEGFFP